MKPTFIDGKDMATIPETTGPTYIVTGDQSSKKSGLTKRHVLYAVSVVLVIAFVLVAILVGMHFFSKSQEEIIKFSLKFKGSDNDDIKQDVQSDPNDNVVLYHVTKEGQHAYVVNDFNRGMQIVKMATEDGTSCYITALNRTRAMDPSLITGNTSTPDKYSNEEATFQISADPVSDRSFLTKKAKDLCKDVPLYWVTKHCDKQTKVLNETDTQEGRGKRTIYNAGYYYGLPGLGGCCYKHYACYVRMVEYIVGSYHYCYTYYQTGTCCGRVARPYCNYYYRFYWRTPGLYC
jgi:hypothetical protein